MSGLAALLRGKLIQCVPNALTTRGGRVYTRFGVFVQPKITKCAIYFAFQAGNFTFGVAGEFEDEFLAEVFGDVEGGFVFDVVGEGDCFGCGDVVELAQAAVAAQAEGGGDVSPDEEFGVVELGLQFVVHGAGAAEVRAVDAEY